MELQMLKHDVVGANEFEEIYQCYQRFVTKRIQYLLGHKHCSQIEDLVQDTFLNAYRAFKEGKTLKSLALANWLARIAKNLTIDMLRKQSNTVVMSFIVADQLYGVQDIDLAEEVKWHSSNEVPFDQRLATRESIERVLGKMPLVSAICLWHYAYNGFSCVEIAELLHMNAAAVRMSLMRARMYFKKMYQYES